LEGVPKLTGVGVRGTAIFQEREEECASTAKRRAPGGKCRCKTQEHQRWEGACKGEEGLRKKMDIQVVRGGRGPSVCHGSKIY